MFFLEIIIKKIIFKPFSSLVNLMLTYLQYFIILLLCLWDGVLFFNAFGCFIGLLFLCVSLSEGLALMGLLVFFCLLLS